jgi:hypothetical protein
VLGFCGGICDSPDPPEWWQGHTPRFKLNCAAEIFGNKNQNPVTRLDRTQFFPICNIFLLKLCANLCTAQASHKSIIMNAIDHEDGSSAEFSDLYLRLLNAALDETDSPLSPQAREHNLAAHVARGISMTDIESFSNQALGHEETTFL